MVYNLNLHLCTLPQFSAIIIWTKHCKGHWFQFHSRTYYNPAHIFRMQPPFTLGKDMFFLYSGWRKLWFDKKFSQHWTCQYMCFGTIYWQIARLWDGRVSWWYFNFTAWEEFYFSWWRTSWSLSKFSFICCKIKKYETQKGSAKPGTLNFHMQKYLVGIYYIRVSISWPLLVLW